MSKSQVGRVFLSHTFSKKKVWTTNFEVGRSAMDVHTFINLWWLAVVWKWYVLFEVIPNESLDFKASLIKSVSKYLNRNTGFFFMYKRGDVKKNVIKFLSKLRIQQQTLYPKCPNFLGRQVGQTEEYLSKFIFVHTRLQGRQGTPNLNICPNFRSFFWVSLLIQPNQVNQRTTSSIHQLPLAVASFC